MLWTLGSAVILAFYRATELQQNELQQNTEGSLAALMQINALFYSLLLGAEVGGLVLYVWRRIHGIAGFPTQPGHWILLVEGASALLVWTGQAAAFVMSGGQPHALLWAAWQIPNCLISGTASLLMIVFLPGISRWWQATFAILSLQYSASLWLDMSATTVFATGGRVFPPAGLLTAVAWFLQSTLLSPVAALMIAIAA